MNQGLDAIGIGSADLWENLTVELKGQTTLEKPRVSKKVMIKAIRLQADAMKSMIHDFAYMSKSMALMEKEVGDARVLNDNLQRRTMSLEKSLDSANGKIEVLEEKVAVNAKKLTRIEYLETAINGNKNELATLKEMRLRQNGIFQDFVKKTISDLDQINQRHSDLHAFAQALEDRMNSEKEELTVSSNQVFVEQELTLDEKLKQMEAESVARENGLKESEARLLAQSSNLQELLLEARRTMEQNAVKVEQVQRELLDKADRANVDDVIESKYEEIIAHLQKALSSINDDEVCFCRHSTSL